MGQRFPALSVRCTWWKLFFTLLVLSCAQTESSSHSVFFFFLLIDHILFTQVKHTPLAEKDNTTEQPPPLVWLSISQPWNDSQDYSRTFYSLSDSVHELLWYALQVQVSVCPVKPNLFERASRMSHLPGASSPRHPLISGDESVPASCFCAAHSWTLNTLFTGCQEYPRDYTVTSEGGCRTGCLLPSDRPMMPSLFSFCLLHQLKVGKSVTSNFNFRTPLVQNTVCVQFKSTFTRRTCSTNLFLIFDHFGL